MDMYKITRLVLDFVEPLATASASPAGEAALLAELGYLPPEGFALLSGLAAPIESLAGAAIELADAPADATESAWLAKFAKVSAALAATVTAVQDFALGLDQQTKGNPFVTGTDVLQVLPGRLANHLVARFLALRLPSAYAVLVVTGVMEVTIHEDPNQPYLAGFVEHTLHWDLLPKVISDPLTALRTRYDWANPAGIDVNVLVHDLRTLFGGFGLRAELLAVDRRAVTAFDLALAGDGKVPEDPGTLVLHTPILPLPGSPLGVEVYPVADPAGSLDGLGIALFLDAALGTTIQLTETLRAELSVGAYTGGFGLVFRRGRDPQVTTPVLSDTPASVLAGVEVDVALALVLERPGPPLVPLGTLTDTHLEIGSVTATVSAGKPVSGAVDLGAEIKLQKGALVVRADQGDAFISKVFGDGFTVNFDVTVGFSTSRGLHFAGAAGTEFTLPVHKNLLGVLMIDSLYFALRLDPAELAVTIAAAASVSLGPFVASVEGMGLRMDYALPQGQVLSPQGPVLRFKPPTGVGLAIRSPAVSGGGFLLFDPDAGQYAGVFALTIVGTVSVKAIAIITTKMPDGSAGFALLILITAEGFTPVQLGLGFALTGIGGLLAINHTLDADTVRGGLQNGVLDSILFVKDPIKNAPRILGTLNHVFPLAADRLLIGPLAEISWGTPPLVKVRLALLLEVPQPIRVILLAALSMVLPAPESPIVEIHIDAIGVLDLGKGELALDASLHDSRILQFTLTGDMALRLNFGIEPTFLVSLGGFHPRYAQPKGLRPLNRLALTLSSSDNPRVRFEAYLALTSNTVQMGARVDVHAEDSGLALDGGGSFDGLIQWSPFALDVSFSAWAKVTSGGNTLMAASLALEVTGPQPWHLTGQASVQILAFTATVSVDFTVGSALAAAVVDLIDVAAEIWALLSDPAGWQAVLPAAATPGVTLAGVPAPSGTAPLVAHPLATVSVRQQIAPLDTPIERVGGRLPVGGTRSYTASATAPAGVATGTVTDLFAPGQYANLPDDARLSGPSFQPMHGGVILTPQTAAAAGPGLSCDLAVQTLDVTSLDTPATPGALVTAAAATARGPVPATAPQVSGVTT